MDSFEGVGDIFVYLLIIKDNEILYDVAERLNLCFCLFLIL